MTLNNTGAIMITQNVRFSVLVLNAEVRSHILSLLRQNEHFSVAITSLDELIDHSKREANSIILVDSEAVLAYGMTAIAKLRTSCPECKLILLCSKTHRSMIEHVIQLGAYGCIIEPYREWEFLTMVRLIPKGQKAGKKIAAREAKRPGKSLRRNGSQK
jgi:DNA-binding NarL/FixJ family response regulator